MAEGDGVGGVEKLEEPEMELELELVLEPELEEWE